MFNPRPPLQGRCGPRLSSRLSPPRTSGSMPPAAKRCAQGSRRTAGRQRKGGRDIQAGGTTAARRAAAPRLRSAWPMARSPMRASPEPEECRKGQPARADCGGQEGIRAGSRGAQGARVPSGDLDGCAPKGACGARATARQVRPAARQPHRAGLETAAAMARHPRAPAGIRPGTNKRGPSLGPPWQAQGEGPERATSRAFLKRPTRP